MVGKKERDGIRGLKEKEGKVGGEKRREREER